MAVDQHVAHGEILRQAHHGVVNRRIAVRMIVTEHVAYTGGGFFKGFIRTQTRFVHRVQDSAVHRFQAVANIGQRAADDDAHGIIDIAPLHFTDQFRLGDNLVREENVFRFIVSFMCHSPVPQISRLPT